MSNLIKSLISAVLLFAFSAVSQADVTVTYLHTDAAGSVVAASDENGDLQWRKSYLPYGGKHEDGQSKSRSVGYTGHTHDVDTGLTYMKARSYDPDLGRFIQMDPAAVLDHAESNPAMFNRFAYANNNPYRYKDPTGGVPVDTIWDAVSVVYDIGKIVVGYTVGNQKLVVEGGIDLAVDSAALVIPYVPAGSSKYARWTAEGVERATSKGALPKPPTGPGKVPKSERDPKRLFTASERKAKRAEQGNQCANGCGTEIDASNSAGHHVERHADGGRTASENHAEVCTDCHKELHSRSNK